MDQRLSQPIRHDARRRPDNDGIENLLEFVLNGNPAAPTPPSSPTLAASGANFVFTFTRRELSANDTTQVFEYGTDLGGWTTAEHHPPPRARSRSARSRRRTANRHRHDPESPRQPGGRLFGRLRLTQP